MWCLWSSSSLNSVCPHNGHLKFCFLAIFCQLGKRSETSFSLRFFQYSFRLGSSGELVPFTMMCRSILNHANLRTYLPVRLFPKTQRSCLSRFRRPQYCASVQHLGFSGCILLM